MSESPVIVWEALPRNHSPTSRFWAPAPVLGDWRPHRVGLELPPPEARTGSDDPAKHTREMGLVAHSALKSDLCNRLSSVQQDGLGMAHPSFFDIGEGSPTEALSECAREVADAELYDAGEVRNAEVEADVRLDVGGQTFCLPGGEATPVFDDV